MGHKLSVTGIFLSALLIFFFSCKSDQARWKGTFKTQDGIRVAKNPIEPINEHPQISFIEELRIGDKEYVGPFFENILPYSSLDVDSAGNIYILDEKACQIMVMSPNGDLIRKISHSGQGPGEFQSPVCLRLFSGGKIAVYDSINLRITYFTSSGDLSSEINLGAFPPLYTPQFDSFGNLIGVTLQQSEQGRKLELVKIFADGSASQIIASASSRSVFDGKTINLYIPRIEAKVTLDGDILWGVQSDYILNVVNRDGQLISKITKEYVPIIIGKEDINNSISAILRGRILPSDVKIVSPPYFNPVNTFFIDDEGNIFVKTPEKTNNKTNIYEVFDKSGRYIYKIPISGNPILIKMNKMYTIEENEEGIILVKRYRIVHK